MKVWVVYCDYGPYECYDSPEKAFDSHEKAKNYADAKNKKWTHLVYEVMELIVE